MIRLLAGSLAAVLAAAVSASAAPPDLCLRLQDGRPPIVCVPSGGGPANR